MRHACLLIAALFSGFTATAALAANAGKFVYAFGDVRVVDAAGTTRGAGRGAPINSGDTVVTRQGRAHLRFTDGGFAALQPNTEYRLDDYQFNAEDDASSHNFLSLVKGAVRLVTGAIGKKNESSFQLRTAVATIGIRGTEGLVETCNNDCGDKENGTYLTGYGGTWTLESGEFKGVVESGESYACQGGDSGCSKQEGPSSSREEVQTLELETAEEEPAQQGNQVGDDGRQCDVGGACGGDDSLLGQIGATISPWLSGSEFGSEGGRVAEQASPFSGPVIVFTEGGKPVATLSAYESSLSDGGSFTFSQLNMVTLDAQRLRTALQGLADEGLRTRALAALDQVEAEKLTALAAAPARVADEDFGTTSDGLLTKGRLVGGNVLLISQFSESENGEVLFDELSADLETLTGNQASHFIYGVDPGPIAFTGVGVYSFTGGTLSSSLSGETTGRGVTGGSIVWNFGLSAGELAMTVEHASTLYDVKSSLFGFDNLFFDVSESDRSLFVGDFSGVARTANDDFDVGIYGFFAGPNGDGAPRAIGLSYEIDTDDPIIGVAGFGLGASQSGTILLPAGSLLFFSHAFIDPFDSELTANGGSVLSVGGDEPFDDQTIIFADGSVKSFVSNLDALDLCSDVSCSVNIGSGSAADRGRNVDFRVEWGRITGVYGLQVDDPAVNLSPRGPLHYIYTTAQTFAQQLPSSGVMSYNTVIGGTTPTRTTADGSSITGTHQVGITIDYGAGDITDLNIVGNFTNGASYQFATLQSVPLGIGFGTAIDVSSQNGHYAEVIDPACAGSCSVFNAGVAIQPVGNGGGVIGSYGTVGFNSTVPVTAINGTFLVGPGGTPPPAPVFD